MTSLNQDIREKLSRLNVFEKIIVANTIVYLFCFITFKDFKGSGANLEWLSLSKSASRKCFQNRGHCLTYGFTTSHSFIHLFFNMVSLVFLWTFVFKFI